MFLLIDVESINYKIKLYHYDESKIDPNNANMDIEILCSDGRRYAATFFTVDNIKSMVEKDKIKRGYSRGAYFWCNDMIIVSEMTVEVIRETIKSIIVDGDLEDAFIALTNSI